MALGISERLESNFFFRKMTFGNWDCIIFQTHDNFCRLCCHGKIFGGRFYVEYPPALSALATHCTDWRPLLDWIMENSHSPEQQRLAAVVTEIVAAVCGGD